MTYQQCLTLLITLPWNTFFIYFQDTTFCFCSPTTLVTPQSPWPVPSHHPDLYTLQCPRAQTWELPLSLSMPLVLSCSLIASNIIYIHSDDSQKYIFSSDSPLNARLTNPTVYLTFPLECQTGISNLACPKLNSSQSPLNSLFPWFLPSHLRAIPSLICSGQKPSSYPWFLSFPFHIWSISKSCRLDLIYILNSPFCHLCCHQSGTSHYPISPSWQPWSIRSPCFYLWFYISYFPCFRPKPSNSSHFTKKHTHQLPYLSGLTSTLLTSHSLFTSH